MKNISTWFVAVGILISSHQAQSENVRAVLREIPTPESVKDWIEGFMSEAEYGLSDLRLPNYAPPFKHFHNSGSRNWDLYRRSLPALGFQFHLANSIGPDVFAETELEHWGPRQYHTYQLKIQSAMRVTALKASYTMTYRTGGRDSEGNLAVGSVMVMPHSVSSYLGYKLNASVCGITTSSDQKNIFGYKVHVAQMTIPVCLEILTPLITSHEEALHFLRGDSNEIRTQMN